MESASGPGKLVHRLAADLALESDPVPAIETIRSHDDPAALIQQIATVTVKHRTTLPVLERLAGSGIDLEPVPIDRNLLSQSPVIKLLAPDRRTEPPTDLAALRAFLAEHQRMLRDVASAIGEAFPHQYMVAFGLGTDLFGGGNTGRESSDVDMFSRAADACHELASWLVAQRNFISEPTEGWRAIIPDLVVRKLWIDVEDHRIGVDLFGPGRPSLGHSWIPPYRDPGLMARAQPVAAPGPAVLVAAPEDALAVLAEKTLRKGEFTHRRIHDALSILSAAHHVDPKQLAAVARSQHVVAPLRWLLERAEERGAVVDELLQPLEVARWERRMVHDMANASPRRSIRMRGLHRRIWVARYVRDASHRGAAIREVMEGRYRRPPKKRTP